MLRLPGLFSLCLIAGWTGSLFSQQRQGMLDVIPADAAAALAIRNLEELEKKGDKFVADVDLKLPIRPSQLFADVYRFLGIQGGVDTKGSAAIILLRPEKEGGNIGDFERLLVGALPFTDLDKLAVNFGFKPGELKPKIIAGKDRDGGRFGKFFFARDKHLFLSQHEPALKRLSQAKPLSGQIDPRSPLGQADILLHFAPAALGEEWKFIQKELEREFGPLDDPAEEKVRQQFISTLASLRSATGGVHIDDGLGLNLAARFAKEKNVQEFLTALRSTGGPSHLKGLPEGRVVAAQAMTGDGRNNILIARLVVHFLLKNVLETNQIVSATDRPNFVGVFTEVWQRLQGSRAAVYLTADEAKRGLFSLVAILDAHDAVKLFAEMKTLAKIADGSVLDLKKKPKEEEIDVAKLVRDLGDDTYRVRESATTRLRLLGEPALAYLEKTINDSKTDLETVRRAQKLREQISRAAAQRRKELLAKDLPPFVRPSFFFVPQAETRAGVPVHVIKVKLADKDLPINKQMQQLLGPEWDHVRLAVLGNQVVVLLGSEIELLESALVNVKEGKAGLAGAKSLAAFSRRANPARSVEFHLSVDNLMALTNPNQPVPRAKAGQFLSSISLTVQPQRMQLDLWFPTVDVKRLVKDLR